MKKILVLGDSHAVYFSPTNEVREFQKSGFSIYDIETAPVRGGTVTGFGRRNSSKNMFESFKERIIQSNPDYVCFALGQVDIELGYFYRTIIKGEKLDAFDFIDSLTTIYTNAVETVKQDISCNFKILFKGINISVLTELRNKALRYTKRIITENISDENDIKKYSQILKTQYPSVAERYENHLYFNQLLKQKMNSDYGYFDVNSEITDPHRYGHCNRLFVPSKFDHHLSDSLFMRDLHIRKLFKCVSEIDL